MVMNLGGKGLNIFVVLSCVGVDVCYIGVVGVGDL